MENNFISRKISIIILVISFGLAISVGGFRLTENPPTWLDEGMIIQTAKNLATLGEYKVQVAPDVYVSPGFISTSYPVTFPIALVFKIFGVGLLQARLVMFFYLLAVVAISGFFVWKYVDHRTAPLAVLLLATFPPLYGNGKNVLGEVPGFFWLMSGLFLYHQLETKKDLLAWRYIFCGLFFGLAVSTKPIFILLLPAILLSFLASRSYLRHDLKNIALLVFGLAAPIVFWSLVQFNGDSFFSTLRYYSNPHDLDMYTSIRSKLVGFFTQAQPLYCLIIYLIWAGWGIIRLRKKVSIPAYEYCSFFFSGLVILAYLRTPDYYRYFFLAELFSLIFLPSSFLGIVSQLDRFFSKKIIMIGTQVFIFTLILAQSYQLFFTSWVAIHFHGNKTEMIETAIRSLPVDKPVFVFKVAEITPFLKSYNYFQYLSATKSSHIGLEQLERLLRGDDLRVITGKEILINEPKYFNAYKVESEFASYAVLVRKEDL